MALDIRTVDPLISNLQISLILFVAARYKNTVPSPTIDLKMSPAFPPFRMNTSLSVSRASSVFSIKVL